MSLRARFLGALAARLIALWRLTCASRVLGDPRPRLRQAQQPYVMALKHAHQLAALCACDEPHLAVLVSRSQDGELLVPALGRLGIRVARGSSRRGGVDKGGREALDRLKAHVRAGGTALIAVDGPRGPAGKVHGGILHLARATGAVILPVAAHAHRRWRLTRTWDEMRIPLPFTRLTLRFGVPIAPANEGDVESTRHAVALALEALDLREAAPD